MTASPLLEPDSSDSPFPDTSPAAPRPGRARYVIHLISLPTGIRAVPPASIFPAGRLRLVRMLDQVLDAFDSEPRFQHFNLGETYSLEEYLAIRPEYFERIEEAVQEGKLQIGPWYALPDSAPETPEALIRNLMLGLRTARVFGPPALVGYVQSAHAAGAWLPQIFKGFGIDVAVLVQAEPPDKSPDELAAASSAPQLPLEFTWQGNDGTRLVACWLPASSTVGPDTPDVPESRVAHQRERLAPYAASGHILLALPWERVDSIPATISSGRAALPDDIFHSTLSAYAQAVRTFGRANPQSLSVVPADAAFSVFASASHSHRRDEDSLAAHVRYSEALLTTLIEPFCAWLENTDTPQAAQVRNQFVARPQRLLEKLWRDFLLNRAQPGSLDNRDDAEVRYEHIDDFARLVEAIFPRGETSDSDEAGDVASISGERSFGIRPIRLVRSSDPAFVISATKLPQDPERSGVIVRGCNTSDQPIWVTLLPWRPFAVVDVVALDEVPTGGHLSVEPEPFGALQFKAAPHRLLTFWLHD